MTSSSQYNLLCERRFLPFFLTQFAGAFNDNLFKQVLVLLVTFHASTYTTMAPELVTSIAAGLFILPFVLFSAIAGQIADRFDKSNVILAIKGAEVLILMFASWGFFTHSIWVLLAALFLMGAHSAFFGPVKYSILPQTLSEKELVGGNGLVEMGTFLAILLGTLMAGVIVTQTSDPAVISAILTAIACFGFFMSMAIPSTESAAPGLQIRFNIWTQTLNSVALARRIRSVWLSLLGISWFWFFGALVLTQIPSLAKNALHGDATVVTLLLGVFSIGVALGSLLCEKLSAGRVELGLVPFGSIGLSIFALALYHFTANFPSGAELTTASELAATLAGFRVLISLSLLGLFGGFFIVPLYALVQSRAPKSEQSRIISANNILNALFMVASAGVGALLHYIGVSVPGMLAVCALLNGLVALYIYSLVPEFLWRFMAWIMIHTVYRVDVRDASIIPETGAVLLAPNHVSYADALVVSAASPRPIRFVMDHQIFKIPVMGWLFRAAKAIPIASFKDSPETLEAAYISIGQALKEGEIVCIFPEGRLTSDGQLGELKGGLFKVAQEHQVDIIPMSIDGLEGSVFARCKKQHDAPRFFWRKIRVNVGARFPSKMTPEQLRESLLTLKAKRD